MKRISYKEYNSYMGKLIDIEDPVTYNEGHKDGSINIPYEKLLLHHNEILEKNTPYYIICRKGIKSRKAVNILEFYGYNVTQVYIE